MAKYGYELPPYFYPPQDTGAHITVVATNEMKAVKREVEVGERVEFRVSSCGPTFPTRYWYGVEAVYNYRVTSPELARMRQDLTGKPGKPPGGFHITVGIRKIKKKNKTRK